MMAQRVLDTIDARRLVRLRALTQLLGEITVFAIALMLLSFARPGPSGLEDAAVQHGLDTVRIEQKLHIYYERDIQSFSLRHGLLEQAANAVYTVGYYPLLAFSALWLYWRNRDHYRLFRNTFLATILISYAVFLAYPVAPPRYFPEFGFQDTLAQGQAALHYAKNPFAAVPSLHFAGALLAGVTIALATRRRLIRLLGALAPVAMLLTIVVTGNHFFMDAVAAVPVLGAGFLGAIGLEKWYKARQERRQLADGPLLDATPIIRNG